MISISELTYFDACAGSGVASYVLDKYNFECEGYSEIDKYAIKNYEANFPNRENFGDLTELNYDEIPSFDLLVGGTPCQNLSTANSKENQKGLQGEKSSIFYDYIRLLNNKKPKWFIFENVRGLLTSNNKQDFKIVKQCFEENYNIKWKLMNTSDYGVPQTRRRVYIVGQRKDLGEFDYIFKEPFENDTTVFDLLENHVEDKYYATEKGHKYIASAGSGGYYAKPETDLKIARPLTATMHKWHRAGQDNYYHTEYKPKDRTNLRRLTPRECARLQGLPDTYKIVISNTRAYMLFGNSMSANVLNVVVENLVKSIK